MKSEYEQPHLVTKATTDTATAKHSDPSVAPAAVFLFFFYFSISLSLAFVGNAPLVGPPPPPVSARPSLLICSGCRRRPAGRLFENGGFGDDSSLLRTRRGEGSAREVGGGAG